MAIVEWPPQLTPVAVRLPVLERLQASAGVSIAGIERLVANDSGRWQYGLRVPLRSAAAIMAWRALLAQTEGRMNPIRMPIFDCRWDAVASAGLGPLRAATPQVFHDDGASHSDGSGYATSWAEGLLTAAAAQGATSLSLTLPSGIEPLPGHHFSIADRLYQVSRAVLAAGVWSVTFLPRLRLAAEAGAAVQFDGMTCLMRFASDAQLQLEADLLAFGDLDLTLVEWIA